VKSAVWNYPRQFLVYQWNESKQHGRCCGPVDLLKASGVQAPKNRQRADQQKQAVRPSSKLVAAQVRGRWYHRFHNLLAMAFKQ
jgi:hypothetical protein